MSYPTLVCGLSGLASPQQSRHEWARCTHDEAGDRFEIEYLRHGGVPEPLEYRHQNEEGDDSKRDEEKERFHDVSKCGISIFLQNDE
jgi:hypothetical protein